jgi:N-methylhydantoinase B
MLMCGPEELRAHANASGALAVPLANFTVGITEQGDHVGVDAVAGGAMNPLAGGFGAFPQRDGVDTGGSWWLMNTTAGNAEEMEKVGVVIAIYRIEKTDSGGPGQWRGGNGVSLALMKHKIFSAVAQFAYIDSSANTAMGLGGGYYGLGGNYLKAEGIDGMLASGTMAGRREDLEGYTGGALERLHPRAIIFPLPEGDCLITEYNGGGGFGDPLLRDPGRVAADIAELRVGAGAADRHWGVVLDKKGHVDSDATARRRDEIRAQRLSGTKPDGGSLGKADGATVLIPGAGGNVDLVGGDGAPQWACSICAELLGPATLTFKSACAQLQRKPQEVDALMYCDPAIFGDPAIMLRQYLCPSCATLLSQEFCHAEDAPYPDTCLEAANA